MILFNSYLPIFNDLVRAIFPVIIPAIPLPKMALIFFLGTEIPVSRSASSSRP